jgi:hypothetical protein
LKGKIERGYVSDFKAEPDNVFSQKEWDEIARSIPLDKLPEEMKQAISEALSDYFLMSSRRPRVRQALTSLARLLQRLVPQMQTLRAKLSTLDDLRPENVIDQVEALIDQAYALQQAAQLELEKRPKEKVGRPPELDRNALVERLICVYDQYSGRPVGLSRNKKDHKPSGPCYRFISTILNFKQISTKGIEHIIEESRDMPKTHP